MYGSHLLLILKTSTMAHTTIDYQVGIIGAGFAGLVAALRLKKSGRNSFVVFEKSSEAGGTWRDNIYPGCACDIASPLYSFSGEPNPEWSRRYASQPEIFAYIRQVIQKNGLQSHIQYNTEIVEALFRKESGAWVLRDQQGRQVRVRLLVLALGPLNRPSIPDFPGMGDFKGTMFHSSQWNTGCGLTGKRVAVIGTGASAIQIIPSIVPIVSQLLVFQRTPPWVSPRMDRKITPAWQQRLKKYPFLMKMEREIRYWINELLGAGFIGNKLLNKLMQQISLKHLAKQVGDPEVRRRLTPNYTIGCKPAV
jgi:cation diffusion facilitator CzcD-associated flavoprotein CzcO